LRLLELPDVVIERAHTGEQAIRADPVFPPAFLRQMQLIWQRDDPSRRQKQIEESRQLIDRAARSAAPGLADALRGVMLQRQGEREQAITALEAAVKARDSSPDSGMLLARLRLEQQEHAKFEQAMWRVISDHPAYEEAYQRLILYYLNPGLSGGGVNVMAARQVLDKWLSADPSNVTARMIAASLLSQRGQTQDALRLAGDLVRQNANDSEVLQQAEAIYVRAGMLPQYIKLLEELLERVPVLRVERGPEPADDRFVVLGHGRDVRGPTRLAHREQPRPLRVRASQRLGFRLLREKTCERSTGDGTAGASAA
jgi:tetratricopeptide (TPR) repeat protein